MFSFSKKEPPDQTYTNQMHQKCQNQEREIKVEKKQNKTW